MRDPTLFINYAREDLNAATRLYRDLTSSGLKAWLDKESLLPGQKWEAFVRNAIKNSRYFSSLISRNSVEKKGYVQREVRMALEILEEFPDSEIYIIPVRLDDSKPSHQKLRDLHWVDMFPDWQDGLNKILLAVGLDSRIPTWVAGALGENPTATVHKSRTELMAEPAEAKRGQSAVFRELRSLVPGLSPQDLRVSDLASDQAELDSILADPTLPVDHKVTLMIMQSMKKMDQDIEHQQEVVSQSPGFPASLSLDLETMKLKRLIDKRGQMFDMLRQIIDKYNQTAKGIIDSIGR